MEINMHRRIAIGALVFGSRLIAAMASARPTSEVPDLRGEWHGTGNSGRSPRR